mgnify:CR=1 FL=1|tara:strand:+ start:5458 stop:6987 length:1530 start_codon:yes stop_codon:yes gene_type:complete
MDVLFINANASKKIYQDLSKKYSAKEPPTWSLLLAQSCRSVGHDVAILDCCAEELTHEETVERIKEINPRLLCFVVYGQNVNAGTTSMAGATALSEYIKECGITTPIAYVGSHVQSLPYETLEKEKSIDIVFTNEGVYALRNLLNEKEVDLKNLEHINGIGFRRDGKPFLTMPERVVPQDRMDIDLPGYAWDLLPYKERPFDLYRSPMWHAEYDHNKRTPYAALQTSLGCNFACEFCMINIVNRNDNDPIGVAGNYSKMRYWSPEFIIKEFDKLIDYGVTTIRITDEMFLLNPKYYIPLCEMLAERNKDDKLIMWAYSRIDTIRRPGILSLVRKAGIKWLCLGIESADKKVRLEVSKGKFEDVDIEKVVKSVHDADIEIMANYIFGLPGDDRDSIQKTLDLSLELCTVGWNAYAAMALPGSQLYKNAIIKGHKLPEDYAGYSFHAYNTQPLPTQYLKPEEILKFRDEAYTKYHTYPPFLEKIEKKYGKIARENIEKMTKVKLKRKILGD